MKIINQNFTNQNSSFSFILTYQHFGAHIAENCLYGVCSKSAETEAVFTKILMNNKRNVIFKVRGIFKIKETEIAFTKTEISSLFKNCLRLKLYLPKQN